MLSSEDALLNELLQLLNKQNSVPVDELLPRVFAGAAWVARADGCFFFRVTPENFMNLAYGRVESLQLSIQGSADAQLFPSVFLSDIKNKPRRRPQEVCALLEKQLNFVDVFSEPDIETDFLRDFDAAHNYTSSSLLAFPLFDSKQKVIGVMMFVNAKDLRGRSIPFNSERVSIITAVCQIAANALERKYQAESYAALLESFIDILAKAIDAKSPYTGQHCQKVPVVTRLLAAAAIEEKKGPLKYFDMTDDDLYALHIASWLHDCGKITTPEYIIDKATKLETIYNRIHEIRNRFEILRRDAHIVYLQKRLHNVDTQEKLQAEFVAKVKQLEDDFAFVAQCNMGEKMLSDEDVLRLDNISKITFMRYFNRMLGLSWAERENVEAPEAFEQPAYEALLQNRPDQIFGVYNRGELYNLNIPRGTINKEEREKINEHIKVTIDMLKALPFPKELSKVVEYAGCHHERVDGQGYPNGLTGKQMSVPAKIMAIADVFEALTASDRPYKEPKKLSEVLMIMRQMKISGHIDPDLYDVFIRRKIYQEFADNYLKPEQIDEINPEDYL